MYSKGVIQPLNSKMCPLLNEKESWHHILKVFFNSANSGSRGHSFFLAPGANFPCNGPAHRIMCSCCVNSLVWGTTTMRPSFQASAMLLSLYSTGILSHFYLYIIWRQLNIIEQKSSSPCRLFASLENACSELWLGFSLFFTKQLIHKKHSVAFIHVSLCN